MNVIAGLAALLGLGWVARELLRPARKGCDCRKKGRK